MTTLKLQKRLAAQVAKTGKNKVVIDSSQMKDVKDAITKQDIRSLIRQGIIKIKPASPPSRYRVRKRRLQKKKGRQRGQGKRKGKQGARAGDVWINKIRTQRRELRELKNSGKLETSVHRNLYRKAKGGFFRSRKHLLTYIEQNELLKR